MILKYRLVNVWEPGVVVPPPEWSWIDGLERVETMGLSPTSPVAECFRMAISLSAGDENELLVLWLHHRDGGLPTYLAFGHNVEAFLLNDKGDTIDRLNYRAVSA